jgi:hypothetical protein
LIALSTIILPAILGFITNRISSVMDKLANNADYAQRSLLEADIRIWWVGFGFVLVLQILFGLISLFRPSTAAEALDAIAKLTDEKRTLSAELDITRRQRDRYLSLTQGMKDALAVVFVSFERRTVREYDSAQREKDLNAILNSFFEMRAQIFKYRDAKLFYNLAVYIYDPLEQILKVAWRKSHPQIRIQNRTWKPGFGHIGHCFLQKEVIITPDLCDGRFPNSTVDDKEYYRAAAAVPILDDGQAIGVFVITSNEPGQFGKFDQDGRFLDLEMRDTMETLGHLLSVYWIFTQRGVGHDTFVSLPNSATDERRAET